MTESDKANLIREKLKGPLDAICDVITDARRDSFEVHLVLGVDPNGRSFVQVLKITKDF